MINFFAINRFQTASGSRRRTHVPALATLLLTFVAVLGASQDGSTPRLNLTRANVAVQGYDVVAYFTESKPVKGSPATSFVWQGATWHFSSAANRDLFAKAPDKYAPQFGGFCAWAVSRNYTAAIDPAAWTIANGRLFLNYSPRVQQMWLQDRDGNIAKGDANWPALSRKK